MFKRRDIHKTQQEVKKELTDLRRRIVELEQLESVPAKEISTGAEEELKAILNDIRHGIILLDLTGKIISINKRITEISGYTEKDIVGKRLNRLKMFPPQDITTLLTAFIQVISGKTLTVEVEAYAKTGEKLFIEIDGTLLRIGGKTERVIAFLRDVTARRQTEEALRESEEELEAIFNEVRDGIVLLDLTGKIIKINRRIVEVTGYTEKYIVGKRFDFFKNFPPSSIAKMTAAFIKAATGQQIPPIEIIGYTKTGEKRFGEVYGSLVKKKGKATGVIVVMTDITDRKQAEEALRESERKSRSILETMEDGYFEVDLAGNFTFVNDALCEIHGRSRDEMINLNNREYSTPATAKKIYAIYNKIYKTGIPAKIVDYKVIRKDGSIVYVEDAVSILRNTDGEPIGFYGVSRDRTEQMKAEIALRESEEKYRSILSTMTEGYFEVDLRGTFTFCNEAECRIHKRSYDEMIGLNNREFSSPETAKKIYAIFNKVYRTGVPAKAFDYEVIRKDGSVAIIETSASPLRNAAGEIIGFYGVSRDRTEQKKAEEALRENEEKYRTIIEKIEDGYYEVDLAGNFTFVNDAMCAIQGYTRDELIGMNNREYMDEKTAKKVYKIFNAVLRTGKSTSITGWQILRKDKTKREVESSVSLIRDHVGNPAGFRGVIRDITARKQAEEELQYRATHDVLTDLPNRLLFSDRLSLALMQAQRNQKRLAVMLLDMDYFKNVNDTMGHSAGDRLLRVVGNRLSGLLRSGDTVARVGGDEFLLLLSEIGGIEDANTIAQKILEAFRKPFILDEREIMITTSIGVAIFPDDGDNADILVKYADVAMYRAKDKGRDNFQRYTPV